MKFKVTIECAWFDRDGNTVFKKINKDYRVTAEDFDHAGEKAEEKAMDDDNFQYGKPDMANAVDVEDV